MADLFETVSRIGSESYFSQRELLLQDFSKSSGWNPSYSRETPEGNSARVHLFVEHGLQNAAVISFLRPGSTYFQLDREDRNKLLSLSYNNLVDWHLAIEADQVHFLYNRNTSGEPVFSERFSRLNTDALQSEKFEEIVGLRPNRNIPALDDALISTISDWKRKIAGELEKDEINESLSTLFNAIIFSRALEDNLRSQNDPRADQFGLRAMSMGAFKSVSDLLNRSLAGLTSSQQQFAFLNFELLNEINALDRMTVSELVHDFYRNRFAINYDYDFSVISVHALSRVYERYVTLLRLSDDPQGSLFPVLAEEHQSRTPGSVYTPQFIARFFARYIQEHVSPASFRKMKVIDPACGSGIFLRTMLELQCDPTRSARSSIEITESFNAVTGIDIDRNAVHATQLSLALLHLVLAGITGVEPRILNDEAINYFNRTGTDPYYDAVMVNPPFIKYEEQPLQIQSAIATALSNSNVAKPDAYLAFLKQGISLLASGGYGCFVLPRSFLLAENARPLRDLLRTETAIHCIVDLSRIPVFDKISAYVILLIFQKVPNQNQVQALLVQCHDFPGRALQDALDHKVVDTPYYQISEVSQDWFNKPNWANLREPSTLHASISAPIVSLNELADVRQGFLSGMDKVFILKRDDIPKGAESLFAPYLRDREISSYYAISNEKLFVFMPYDGERKITEAELRESFPEMFAYLESHKQVLELRKTVQSGRIAWWEPIHMRGPHKLLVPKIVTPHLIFFPRFALDQNGTYAVSHGPYVASKQNVDVDLLAYLTAILNSDKLGQWIFSNCHRYGRGYSLLEVKQLKLAPIPDPARQEYSVLQRIVQLVKNDPKLVSQEGSLAKTELDEILKSVLQ